VKESDVAVILARQAGEVILRAWDKPNIEIEQKGEINLVTAIDRHCEELILSGLEHDFPGYGILSEESPEQPASWPARWIIDPLDGTTNFIKKYPFLAVSIALEVEGALVSGVVYNPIADELFVAERGQGAKLNGMPVHPSAMTSLSRAVLASGFPYDAWTNPENNARQWSAFLKRTLSLRCDGSHVKQAVGSAITVAATILFHAGKLSQRTRNWRRKCWLLSNPHEEIFYTDLFTQ
jgi:myo-inositol-1(or 4)-monophosphatase